MKNITILLMFFLFSINVYSEDSRYVSARVWVSKPNRYTNAVNGIITTFRDLPVDLKVKLKVYEFLHNEYRPFAINLERPICAFVKLEYKKFFYPDFVKVGSHMPEPNCPILKGNYSFANYTADDANFPSTLPFNNAMLEVAFWYQNEAAFVLQVYITFDRDAIIREKYT